MSKMVPIDYEEALQRILELAASSEIEAESLPIAQALGRITAEEVFSQTHVPPFHRAMMDGYAVTEADRQGNQPLKVMGRLAAGDWPAEKLQPGTCYKIMTGAPIPEGTAAVVRHEWCEVLEQGNMIRILEIAARGESIQNAGMDGKPGELLIPARTRLYAEHLAILSAFGQERVRVFHKPRVSILTTGSELISPGTPLLPGKIYGSNGMFLENALRADGAHIVRHAHIADQREKLQEAIENAAHSSDWVILTGGVSKGDFDFVPSILENIAGKLSISRVLMRPGGPFVAGKVNQCKLIGLSGNPSAMYIQYHVLLRPAILYSQSEQIHLFETRARLAEDIHLKPVPHVRFLRSKARIIDGVWHVWPSEQQSPGLVRGLADCQAIMKSQESQLKKESWVNIQILPLAFS